jgi:uncharacterized protein YdeI (BOF family)
MKRLFIAVALAFVVSTQALAGDIPTSDVVSPPPSDNQSTSTQPQGSTAVATQTTDSESSEALDSLLVSIVNWLIL